MTVASNFLSSSVDAYTMYNIYIYIHVCPRMHLSFPVWVAVVLSTEKNNSFHFYKFLIYLFASTFSFQLQLYFPLPLLATEQHLETLSLSFPVWQGQKNWGQWPFGMEPPSLTSYSLFVLWKYFRAAVYNHCSTHLCLCRIYCVWKVHVYIS